MFLLQDLPKISTRYKSLKAFLVDAQAADKLRAFEAEDVKLAQLPSLSEEQLQKMGLKIGTANRVFALAQQFSPD